MNQPVSRPYPRPVASAHSVVPGMSSEAEGHEAQPVLPPGSVACVQHQERFWLFCGLCRFLGHALVFVAGWRLSPAATKAFESILWPLMAGLEGWIAQIPFPYAVLLTGVQLGVQPMLCGALSPGISTQAALLRAVAIAACLYFSGALIRNSSPLRMSLKAVATALMHSGCGQDSSKLAQVDNGVSVGAHVSSSGIFLTAGEVEPPGAALKPAASIPRLEAVTQPAAHCETSSSLAGLTDKQLPAHLTGSCNAGGMHTSALSTLSKAGPSAARRAKMIAEYGNRRARASAGMSIGRSCPQHTTVHMVIEGLSLADVPPMMAASIVQHMAQEGWMVSSLCVREGCIELVLGIVKLPRHDSDSFSPSILTALDGKQPGTAAAVHLSPQDIIELLNSTGLPCSGHEVSIGMGKRTCAIEKFQPDVARQTWHGVDASKRNSIAVPSWAVTPVACTVSAAIAGRRTLQQVNTAAAVSGELDLQLHLGPGTQALSFPALSARLGNNFGEVLQDETSGSIRVQVTELPSCGGALLELDALFGSDDVSADYSAGFHEGRVVSSCGVLLVTDALAAEELNSQLQPLLLEAVASADEETVQGLRSCIDDLGICLQYTAMGGVVPNMQPQQQRDARQLVLDTAEGLLEFVEEQGWLSIAALLKRDIAALPALPVAPLPAPVAATEADVSHASLGMSGALSSSFVSSFSSVGSGSSSSSLVTGATATPMSDAGPLTRRSPLSTLLFGFADPRMERHFRISVHRTRCAYLPTVACLVVFTSTLDIVRTLLQGDPFLHTMNFCLWGGAYLMALGIRVFLPAVFKSHPDFWPVLTWSGRVGSMVWVLLGLPIRQGVVEMMATGGGLISLHVVQNGMPLLMEPVVFPVAALLYGSTAAILASMHMLLGRSLANVLLGDVLVGVLVLVFSAANELRARAAMLRLLKKNV